MAARDAGDEAPSHEVSAVNRTLSIPHQRQQHSADTLGVGRATGAGLPRPVEVLLLHRTIPTVAHAVRVTRRGHQTLVSLSGHLWWVPSNRVLDRGQPPEVDEAA
jgi:hypothetical protein